MILVAGGTGFVGSAIVRELLRRDQPVAVLGRDAAKTRGRRIVYGIMSFGWRGSARHWRHYRIGYLLLAGLSTPLVLSVPPTVSFHSAISQLPGWHTTIFPPYFVAGAIFSGFAMVVTLMIPARRLLGYQQVVTERHLENMAKVMLATGLMVSYGYVMEHFIAWYSGSELELFAFLNRWQGHYRAIWYVQLFCNVLSPQIFWFRWARRSEVVLFVASILINVGMWAERFVIIAVSLTRDFIPSSWANYAPTWVDWGLLFGSICTFATLFLLFLRFLPAIPIFEVKELRRELEAQRDQAEQKRAAADTKARNERPHEVKDYLDAIRVFCDAAETAAKMPRTLVSMACGMRTCLGAASTRPSAASWARITPAARIFC